MTFGQLQKLIKEAHEYTAATTDQFNDKNKELETIKSGLQELTKKTDDILAMNTKFTNPNVFKELEIALEHIELAAKYL